MSHTVSWYIKEVGAARYGRAIQPPFSAALARKGIQDYSTKISKFCWNKLGHLCHLCWKFPKQPTNPAPGAKTCRRVGDAARCDGATRDGAAGAAGAAVASAAALGAACGGAGPRLHVMEKRAWWAPLK